MGQGCTDRAFEDLLGFVDFKVQSLMTPDHNIQLEPSFQGISICCLEMAQADQVQEYKFILESM